MLMASVKEFRAHAGTRQRGLNIEQRREGHSSLFGKEPVVAGMGVRITHKDVKRDAAKKSMQVVRGPDRVFPDALGNRTV